MRLIDKDELIKVINAGLASTVEEVEGMDEVNAIPVDWLHRELIEQMYNRQLSSEMMSVFHEIIAKWEKEND